MSEENSYWVGVACGALASLVFAVIGLIVLGSKMAVLQEQMALLRTKQESQEKWIEENKTVMQTYEFFNKTWEAILEEKK